MFLRLDLKTSIAIVILASALAEACYEKCVSCSGDDDDDAVWASFMSREGIVDDGTWDRPEVLSAINIPAGCTSFRIEQPQDEAGLLHIAEVLRTTTVFTTVHFYYSCAPHTGTSKCTPSYAGVAAVFDAMNSSVTELVFSAGDNFLQNQTNPEASRASLLSLQQMLHCSCKQTQS